MEHLILKFWCFFKIFGISENHWCYKINVRIVLPGYLRTGRRVVTFEKKEIIFTFLESGSS